MIRYLERPGPLGRIILAATGQGLCGLYFSEHKYFHGPHAWRHDPDHPLLLEAARQLDEYFDGRRQVFSLELDLRGTPFQCAVWQALQALPFGSTVSYRELAQRAARSEAIRATATAIGRNPVSIIVPCHRVIGSSGALSGYAGGLERKHYLLTHEKEREQKPAGSRDRAGFQMATEETVA